MLEHSLNEINKTSHCHQLVSSQLARR